VTHHDCQLTATTINAATSLTPQTPQKHPRCYTKVCFSVQALPELNASLVVCWVWWLSLSIEGSPPYNYTPTEVVTVGTAVAFQDTVCGLKSVRDFIQRESDGLVYTTLGLN
jgi:hypothetical protein